MATFTRTSTKKMEPRPGVKYATEYTRLSKAERRRLRRFVEGIYEETLQAALTHNDYALLEPLRGFPRTHGQANYSAADVMQDMMDQLDANKDVPSGMLGRWNRLFDELPACQIEFAPAPPENNYQELYNSTK